MLLLLIGCVNTGWGDGSDDKDDDRDGGRGDDDAPIACGVNAREQSGDCECDDHYDWCDDGSDDCCAYDARAFNVTVHEVVYAPLNPNWYDEPWDWDGDVPDWMIEVMDALSYVYPDFATAAELARWVDEYAPELLEGTVPPDPVFEIYDGDEVVYVSDSWGDDYEPNFRETFRIDPSGNRDMAILFWDEDPALDDEATMFSLGRDDMAWFAGRGEMTGIYWDAIYAVTWEVEPVW